MPANGNRPQRHFRGDDDHLDHVHEAVGAGQLNFDGDDAHLSQFVSKVWTPLEFLQVVPVLVEDGDSRFELDRVSVHHARLERIEKRRVLGTIR